ncbi:MAG: DUF2520 domain-containing protein [Marinifilaceae bacterium]|jgi:predicted short-subunit dehydrogenase-like oxidoreductase (DUF2520 family)|nr:DUF2520 domain-containing protein [Marinifilaceae bacterium]
MIKSISLIGNGNVAYHIAKAFLKTDIKVDCVYGRNIDKLKEFTNTLGDIPYRDLDDIVFESDLYIISTSDKSIPEIVDKLKTKELKLVHTAGCVNIDVFKKQFSNYGVFYPMQSFSKEKDICFENVPICIEANTKEFQNDLQKLSSNISNKVILMDSYKRRIMHLVAVFVCNFTNHMYHIGEEICNDNNIDFSLFSELIKETSVKIERMLPSNAQTGPAIRNDKITMDEHLKLLSTNDNFTKIYKSISKSIIELNNLDN